MSAAANRNAPRPQVRSSPFSRDPKSPPPAQNNRHNPTGFSSPGSPSQAPLHSRNHSFSPLGSAPMPTRSDSRRLRSNSLRNSSYASGGTFAPKFIKTEESAQTSQIEGGNDFSGKRYVWLRDSERVFVQAQVIEEKSGNMLRVRREDGAVCKEEWQENVSVDTA